MVLGGGAALLAFLAWKLYHTPQPEDPEEKAALPEEKDGEEEALEDYDMEEDEEE